MTAKEIYEEHIRSLGIVGAPAWEDIPSTDPLRQRIEAAAEDEDEGS